jgi:hypothetical protein
MLLTRFLGYFARVEAPTRPAKIRFLLHDSAGAPFALATLKSVEFNGDDATWTINLAPGLRVATTETKPGEKPN